MRLLIVSIMLALFMGACSSGKRAFERGNYYEAVMKSVNRLKSDPNNSKALATLEKAYPFALNYYQDLIDDQLSVDSPFKWTGVIGYLETINKMASQIALCPAAKQLVPEPKKYVRELDRAKQRAAEEQYRAGEQNLAQRTRLSAKEAYYLFKKADNFVRGYKDVAKKILEAKDLATIKVIVEPTDVRSKRYQLSVDFFHDQLMNYLYANHKYFPFAQFYSPEEAKKARVRYPDQVIRLRFNDFMVGKSHLTERILNVESKDSVKVGTVKLKDGSKADVMGIVKAQLKIYKQEIISAGVLDMEVEDFQNNRTIKRKQFPGRYIWFDEWGSFNGDERALIGKELDICNRKQILPPPPQEMFIAFTEPIYAQITDYMRRVYRKY
ncbi:hypothetical protein EMN47_17765 [Prolixibacteraceae bacterium JC049]|nr:hypothetical protein [Prolixibacteraceae bacterium JC049]